ncbi:hypothetical protein LINPERPRIM_LOCUS37696, partial [Linum perenne]
SSKKSLSSSPIRRLPNLSGYLPLRPIFFAATTTTSNHIFLAPGSKFFVLCLLLALGRQQLSTVSIFHLSTAQEGSPAIHVCLFDCKPHPKLISNRALF